MTEHSPSARPSTARSNITRGIAAPVGDGTQTRRSLEQTVPWKYVGYRGYSRFISSDDDFFILRRFSVLNVRVSLALQNQLVMLERQLNELDNKYEGEPQIHNGRFEGDEKDREGLISCIEEKLRKYNELILQQSALRSHKPAPSQDIKRDVTYFSEKRLDLFVSLTTPMIGLAMLVTPLWILQSTTNLQSKLIVITVFIIVFLLVLSFGMVAKPFEALGATAAYAAILMVFMQLGIN
ncbi:ABC transporter transmembrane region 2 domain-containing protein [Trichoderma breve]|uniref:ABC transporter transmembrane region 2 domain-containing protein n=1 Tax=Trichoderma breve TaxID=2034170 RepID=A0A9W9BAI5_9HYPO|nr:ABC transporter transmembrane region 2 domain-containing protein [Trichoderma breve]KAJ4857724.1 ABC transporter transmembrane region 2 domain-containing protein [Trichoderma breve]